VYRRIIAAHRDISGVVAIHDHLCNVYIDYLLCYMIGVVRDREIVKDRSIVKDYKIGPSDYTWRSWEIVGDRDIS